MTAYLLKFILCSGLLLVIYRAFLGSEKLYRFNRFYLLLSLAFSLIVPAITIHLPYTKIPVWDEFFAGETAENTHRAVVETASPFSLENQAQPRVTDQNINVKDNDIAQQPINQVTYSQAMGSSTQEKITPAPKPGHNYFPEILLSLYGAGVLLLLIRFVRNGYSIARLINESTVVSFQDTKLVLVTNDVTPHSFLKYIFLYKDAYYNKTIEPEIICHEQTHVRQRHSLDVIGVELLQVVCWFNPFIPLYRKAIQINHEFLADEAVIANYNDTPAYQYLLLAKASQNGGLSLTSQFNYLVTKKRLIMMTKNTTAAIALYKRLALVPVLAIALFLFSQKIMGQNASKAKPVNKPKVAPKVTVKSQFNTAIEAAKQDAPQSLLDEYSTIVARYHIPYKQVEKINYTPVFSAVDKERLTTLYKQMSPNQQQHQYIRLVSIFPPPVLRYTQKNFVKWQNDADYIVYIDDKQANKPDLTKYKIADFSNVYFKREHTPSTKHSWHWKVTLMTPAYYKAYLAKSITQRLIYIPKKSWKYTNRRIGGVTDASANAQATSGDQRPDYAHQDAPQSVLDEYAVILKKYNFPPDTAKLKEVYTPPYPKHKLLGTPNFSNTDKELLVNLYKQMSREQQIEQWVIFIKSGPPLPRVSLSEAGLNKMKNSKVYGVWVDEKKINNAELNKYKATDFDQVFISKLTATALHHTEYRYQADLMTKAYYARYYKETKTKGAQYYAMAHVPGINKNVVIKYPNPVNVKLVNSITLKNADDEVTNRPLIVVDGKPFEKHIPANFDFNTADDAKYADLISVPTSDIKSISILKETAAVAAWGERGTKGVLLITTKHGG